MTPQIYSALESGAESIAIYFNDDGYRMQLATACEELAELTVELCKKLNDPCYSNLGVIEEIADVLIMSFQLRFIFGQSEVDAVIVSKLDNILTKIRKEKSNG
jgi:hypothetical protein